MRKGTVKKIVALGTGLTMLGATIFGASAAADLSQYPNPLFIQDGKFVGNIVVGKAASTEDVLGAIELSAALQTAAVKQVAVPGLSAVYSVDKEAVQIRRTGREMASFDSIRDVFGAAISESKLPTLLKDGKFEDNEGENKEDVEYTQTLDFVNGVDENVFFEFKEAEDVFDDAAGHYVWIDDGVDAYEYILEFDTPVDFEDAEDIENNVIEIQGNKYTITSATVDGGDLLQKLELLAGETKVWMTQGEPLTRTISGTEHTVILTDVDEDGTRCGISVDGTVQWVDRGSVETINGLEVGVTDAIPVHSAGKDTDVCEVNVGATKIQLEDGNEVKINDESLDNSNADIYNDDANEWGGFALTYEVDDPVYLMAGTGEDSKWTDPVLGNWMINFANVARVDETFEWKRTGSDDVKFVFQNIDDKKVEIQYHYDEDAGGWTSGRDCDEPMLEDGDDVTYADESDLEGVKLLFVAPGDEIHLLEINDVDTTNDKIDIKDITYGKTYNDLDFVWGGGAQAIQLTGTGTLTLDDDGTTLEATDLIDGAANQFTKYEHEVYFESWYDGTISYALDCSGIGSGDIDVRVVENDISLEDGNQNDVYWDLEAAWDGTDEVDFADPVCNDGAATCTDVYQKSDSSDKTSMQSDSLGAIASWDDDDNTGGTLMLPEDQVTAQVFITKVGAVVSSSGAGAVQFQQIQVGTAKLDSDISDVTAQNLLVVGGPCANSVASTLMGSPADCAAGFQEGEAMLKLFEQTNGNVALLVAGYSAMDTRRASKVLANYKDYADSLKGKEVKVKGTTLSDVKVEAVV